MIIVIEKENRHEVMFLAKVITCVSVPKPVVLQLLRNRARKKFTCYVTELPASLTTALNFGPLCL